MIMVGTIFGVESVYVYDQSSRLLLPKYKVVYAMPLFLSYSPRLFYVTVSSLVWGLGKAVKPTLAQYSIHMHA